MLQSPGERRTRFASVMRTQSQPLEVPKVISVLGLIGLVLGMTAGLGLVAVLTPDLGHLTVPAAALAAILFGVHGFLAGIGLGSFLHAPVWATVGALLCLPHSYALGFLLAPLASDSPPGADQAWVMGAGVFKMTAPCAAAVGAILKSWRQTRNQLRD
jgi:hypothetical protein